MVEIKNLFLKYTREFYALYDINLSIGDGDTVAFIGADESGKTSLLRIIAKLENPTKGQVYIKDIPIEKVNFKTDLHAGYLPVTPVFLEKKSVYENFKYILKNWGYSESEIENKINKLIIEFAIEKIKDTKIKDLSLEEKYVLSLIRLSLRELDLLLVDNIFDKISEPTLDVVCELISKLKNKNTTLIVACTRKEIAEKFTKKFVYFKNGSVVENL